MPKSAESLPGSQLRILKSIKGTELPVTIALMRQSFPISALVSLCPGGVLSFARSVDAPAEMQVNGQRFAEGEVVQVGEHYGLKIQTIGPE